MKKKTKKLNVKMINKKLILLLCIITILLINNIPIFIPKAIAINTNLDRVLFIGDSITVGLGDTNSLKNVRATVGDSPAKCYEKINSSYSMPAADNIDYIVLMIGINDYSQTNKTQDIIKKIQELYPSKIIYVQKILPRAKKSSYPSIDINKVNSYNSTIQSYCTSLSNVNFIDTGDGLVGADGYLVEECASSDGLHLNANGYRKLLENIKSKIGTSNSSTETTTIVENNSPYQLTISVDNNTRTFKISYSKYDKEKAKELKNKLSKAGMGDIYNNLLEADKSEGIGETDNNGRLAILAAFVDNGLNFKELNEKSIEYVPKFLKAELASTYPDIRENDKINDEISQKDWSICDFQGIVRLKRKSIKKDRNGNIELDSDNNPKIEEQYLQYVPAEQFENLKTLNDINIEKYFTMDEKFSYITIAEISNSNGNISISTKNINYKSTSKKFAMSFELLESFLIVGQNTDLSDKMIELAYDGTIDIAIMENYNITDSTVKTIIYSGTQQKKANPSNPIYPNILEPQFTNQSVSEDTTRNTTTTYTVKIDNVDTWICTINQNYACEYSAQYGEYGTEQQTEYYVTKDWSNSNYAEDDIRNVEKKGTQSKITTHDVTWKEDGEKESHIKIKDNTGKFEGLPALLAKRRIFSRRYIYEETVSNLYTGDRWIFTMLESSDMTTDQVNLIKYMLYMFFKEFYGIEEDYGVTDEPNIENLFGNLEISDGTQFSQVSGIYGNTIQEKVWFSLKGLGYSDISVAAAMGNFDHESAGFNPKQVEIGYTEDNGGIGICQWTNYPRNSGKGRNNDLKRFAASRGKSWQDEDIQTEFVTAELTKGGGADGYASFSLINRLGYNYSEWTEAKDSESLDEAKLKRLVEVFCFTFENPSYSAGMSSLDRRTSAAKKYYNEFHGKQKPEYSTGNSDIPFTGDKFTDKSGRVFSLYKQGGANANIPYSARNSTLGEKGCGPTCCAIIVSGYGYSDTPASLVSTDEGYSWDTEIINFLKSKGFSAEYNGKIPDEKVKQYLANDYKLIVRVNSGGNVGSYNIGKYAHWYTMLDVDGDKVFVGDPIVKGGGWFNLSSLTERDIHIVIKK